MEKGKSVTQKLIERFERVRAYLAARPALFAAQGTVVATSRTYRGRQLGPYFQLAWRERGRQRRLYLGRSLELVDRIRKLLDQLQQPLRDRRLFARLKRQLRSSLRRWLAEIRPFWARWGIELKGFELRGTRRALRRYANAFYPSEISRLLCGERRKNNLPLPWRERAGVRGNRRVKQGSYSSADPRPSAGL